MTTTEKVAYLKGFADGLGLDKENKQDKLIAAVIDVLETVAQDLDELEETTYDLGAEIDAVSDDLADVEAAVFEDDEDYDDYDDDDYYEDEDYADGEMEDGCCCGGHHHHEGGHCCHHDVNLYEITCPACNNTITIDEDVLAMGRIQCPNCGEMLEFDVDEEPKDDNTPDAE